MLYVQTEVSKAAATGKEPAFNPQLLVGTVEQYIKEIATPPSKEEAAAKENYTQTVIQQGG